MVGTSKALHRYAVVTSVVTFLLLIAGGLVTSTDSGLAVPDWPLSYGMWFPPMVGGILYEHTHRMIASCVGLMILILAVWLWRVEPRRWVRVLGYSALGNVIVQALLGAMTVLLLLPPAVSITHACLGPAVFCLVVCIAQATAPTKSAQGLGACGLPIVDRRLSIEKAFQSTIDDRQSKIPFNGLGGLSFLGVSVATLAGGQLLLGAILRHTGNGLIWHLMGAALLIAGTLRLTLCGLSIRKLPMRLLRGLWLLAGLLVAQLSLGSLAFWKREAVIIVTAHQALGSLFLAQAILLSWALRSMETSPDSAHLYQSRTPRVTGHWTLFTRWRDFVELTKPRLTLLVLLTTVAGFWCGITRGNQTEVLVPLLVGMACVVGGANALNQWAERDYDALMQRTKNRPLPSGRLRPAQAWVFGICLSGLGILMLGTNVHGLAASLALASLSLYLFVYTPLKRKSCCATLVGAIPGALPPVIGWVASGNTLGVEAGVLFAMLFVWQLPHFLSIAVLYREDYARAGFQMLPVIEPEGFMTARQLSLYGLALIPISLLPSPIGLAGPVYSIGALILGAAFLSLSLRASWKRTRTSMRHVFLGSLLYLPILLLFLSMDKR